MTIVRYSEAGCKGTPGEAERVPFLKPTVVTENCPNKE